MVFQKNKNDLLWQSTIVVIIAEFELALHGCHNGYPIITKLFATIDIMFVTLTH